MSRGRRAWLDACPGERRGVVTLEGRPEHLLIERTGAPEEPRLGEIWRVRLTALTPDRRAAFAELGAGLAGVVRLQQAAGFRQGAAIQARVVTEPQGGKAARLAPCDPGDAGPLGRLFAGPSLEAQLAALAPGVEVIRGPEAREAADVAQESALARLHTLKGGVTLAIEPTRALTAVDVDFGDQGSPGGRVLDANLRAIRAAARLLRLKALGGIIAIDLIGFPKAVGLITAEAARAFAAEGREVRVLAPNPLGVMMVAVPRGRRPLHEFLCRPDGQLTARTEAQALVRDLEREGRADPGARLRVVCGSEIAALLRPLTVELGPRFSVEAAPGAAPVGSHIDRL